MINEHKYYGYTGDLVLQDTECLNDKFFTNIRNFCDEFDVGLVINLESPFIKDSFQPIKDKICLGANHNNADKLKTLNPYLINLSNNHINDYGLDGVELTKEKLIELNFPFFGIGKASNIKNIDNTDSRIINVAFTLRSADQSGAFLFATEDIDGPSDLDLSLVETIKRKYPNKFLVVSIHWGTEDIVIPDPLTRFIAKKIIDAGADLIIGHHPHIIQPMEIYKDKMIFYSIGNFYFPMINFKYKNNLYIKKPLKHQLQGLIPIFDFSHENVRVFKILHIYNKSKYQSITEITVKSLIRPEFFYGFFSLLNRKNNFIRLAKYYPKRIFEKVLECFTLKKN